MSVGIVFIVASLAADPAPIRPLPPATLLEQAAAEHVEAVEPRPAVVADASAAGRESEAREEESQARGEAGRGREDEQYDRGTEALDEGAWDEAATAFRSVADMKGRRADAALYWLAYARSKQGQGAQALAIIEDLRRAHPQSRWLKEAKALELEIRQQSGRPTRPENVADEDLKLMALHGLLNTDPEQAIPLLEKFLQGQQSKKLQDQALFVLCQSGSPRAREIVLRIARGESNPELQRRAIQNLGVFGGKESRQALAGIYGASTDPGVKKAVLQAYLVSGDKERVLEVARTEKDMDLRRHAVQVLGAMGAQTELWAMYQTEASREAKKAILQALGVGGGVDRLLEVARSEKDMDLRVDAIRMLGPFGGPTPALLEMYKGGDQRVREAVLQALFVQGNAKALIEIAKTETDPELRKKAVSHLSVMGSKEATAYLLEILNK
jgi:HEAT repeat protein